MPTFLGPLYVDAAEPTEAAPGSVWMDSATAPTFVKIKNEDGNWDDVSAAASAEVTAHTGDATAAHAASAIAFTPDGSIAATDVQAAIVEVRDEAAGSDHEVEVVELAKTSDFAVTAPDSGTTFTNEGAGGTVTLTLPAGGDGMIVHFLVVAAQILKVNTDTGAVIYQGSDQSSGGGGYTQSSDVGAALTLVGVAGGWYARAYTGVWTVA